MPFGSSQTKLNALISGQTKLNVSGFEQTELNAFSLERDCKGPKSGP